jgi:hypothetical protein
MNDRYFVVCGTREEYNTFTYKKLTEMWESNRNSKATFSDFTWLISPEKLMGTRNPHGWFVGTWYKHPNIRKILTQLLIVSDDGKKIIQIHDILTEIEK